MKVKLLKKLRKNFEIVSKEIDVKTSIKVIQHIMVGDDEKYSLLGKNMLDKGYSPSDVEKDLYKSDIDSAIKALPKTIKATMYVLRCIEGKRPVITFYVIKGKMIPFFDYESINELADHYFDFDINHIIRLGLFYLYRLGDGYNYEENLTPSEVIDKLQYKFQRKKYYAREEAEKLAKFEAAEEQFTKVWHN